MSDSRRNTERDSRITVVQIDGLVVMKLVKHCHEVECASQGGIAQGALLGLVADTRLEITHAFPFPNVGLGDDGDVANPLDGDKDEGGLDPKAFASDDDYQLQLMKRLRMVNVDHLHVGWYQSAHFANFLSPQLLESHLAYQTSIAEAVCLIFDTAKSSKGLLSLKAYRLTPTTLALYKDHNGEFFPEALHSLKLGYDSLFEEVPVVIKNSHLVNELLLETQERLPVSSGSSLYLDLATADVLEGQLKHLMDAVDELNQEAIKFNKYQSLAIKQVQEKTKWVQKRQLENSSRIARGEEPLNDNDVNKVFKPLVPPSRLNAMVLAGQIASASDEMAQYCSQSLAKWFATGALQAAKTEHSSGGN